MSEDRAPANPYVGPRTFTEKDSRFFFGRDQEARDLLARVVSERLLLFYAQSGAGKSSLINVRLAPGLREEGFAVLPVGRVSGAVPAGAGEIANIYLFNLMLSIDQGENPPAMFANLALPDFLARLTTEDGSEWCYDAAAAPAVVVVGEQPYVLIIDQFEEIVTAHASRWPERQAFFAELDRAMRTDPNLWVVLTLREDYVAALDPFAALMTGRLRARFYMERMGVSAALDAVREPAAKMGRPFAPGVAEKLVDDLRQVRVAGQDGTAPGKYVEPVQLQVVCYQLWERLAASGDGAPITEADLVQSGDVNQALTQFYEDTLAVVLADPNVAAAGVTERGLRQWFDRELIAETGIRSTVLRNEVSGRTGSLPNSAVDALARRFLVRTELRGGGAWVELVHDRFVEPVRASNAAWWTQHLSPLQQQAGLWQAQGRPDGLLLRGEALSQGEKWAAEHPNDLEPHETAYLEECQAARAASEHEARQTRRIRMLAAFAVGVAVIAVVLALQAVAAQRNADASAVAAQSAAALASSAKATAEAETIRANASEATAVAEAKRASYLAHRDRAVDLVKYAQSALNDYQTDWRQALILAREAVTTTWNTDGYVIPEADAALRAAVSAAAPLPRTFWHGGLITSVAFSRDGSKIVTAGADGTAKIWNSATGERLHILPAAAVGINAAAFSPDPAGDRVVTAGDDGTVRLWESNSGSPLRSMEPLTASVNSATFSPDGKTILAASSDGTARAWDAATGRLMLTLKRERVDEFDTRVLSAGFSPDGKTIVTADGGPSAWLWDAVTGEPLGAVASAEESSGYAVIFAAFTPDGKTIILNTSTGNVELWDAATHSLRERWEHLLHAMGAHTRGDLLYSNPLSPDGQIIVSAPEGAVALVAAASPNDELPGGGLDNAGALTSLAFSPDGMLVLTGGDSGEAQLWSVPRPNNLYTRASLGPASFSPDGTTILTDRGAVWDAETGVPLGEVRRDVPRQARPPDFEAISVPATYSPDGKLIVIATLNYSYTAKLWDALTLKAAITLTAMRLGGGPDPARSIVFSPDSRHILTLSGQGVRLWDVATGASPCAYPWSDSTLSVTPASFSPDGKSIVVPAGDNSARLLDFSTCQEVSPRFVGHTARVSSAVFSPDGQMVLTASVDGTARLWDVKSRNEIRQLVGHKGAVGSARFSPDGKTILTAGEDGTARLWDTSTGQEIGRLEGHAGRVTSAEFSLDGRTITTTDPDAVRRLWIANEAGRWELAAVVSQPGAGAISPDGRTVLYQDGSWTNRLPTRVDDLLDQATRLIQRDSPVLTDEERTRFHLDP